MESPRLLNPKVNDIVKVQPYLGATTLIILGPERAGHYGMCFRHTTFELVTIVWYSVKHKRYRNSRTFRCSLIWWKKKGRRDFDP